ncbi:putative transcription factor [Camellia lanceoleosa]|uniref:Transcription factor n=1 Tax=Camellia lanceoleosa TaxID=1840588 RepID=A0ACC0FIH8_9ERIC|nr:putative transcription factor [Camellia lanceoleosa]
MSRLWSSFAEAEAEAEARGRSSSQDEGEEESESASESECEEKVENEEQGEDQDEGEEGSSSESESECEEKEVEKEEQDEDQDEGEEGSASESESDCEEKEDKNTIPAPLPKKPSSGSAAQHPQSSSSSSSESDSPPVNHCGVDPNMKMMQSSAAAASASASASASAKNKKPTSKKPTCNPTLKRLVVERESENRKSKRAKAVKGKVNVNADGVEDRLNKTSASKKVFFQRLWSAEDEIVILQGIINYTADTGLDPSANINAFYLSIKDFIHVHVTKTQLCDKVRKLKQKYMTNANKAKLPSNSHEQQLYNLSQNIWGFQTNDNNKDVVHGKPTLKEDVSNKMAEIKSELKKLQISLLELLRSTQLICEQTKRVLESLQ